MCPLRTISYSRRSRTGCRCVRVRPDLQRAGRIFLDADLAILAAAPDRLREYDRAIACEWAQDPDAPSAAFREGRKQALEHLRAQVPLFQSAEFAPLTPLAQRNLDTLIAEYA